MIEQGLIQEIETVLDMGYSPQDYGLTGVGYAEFIDMIISKDYSCLEQCTELATQHTRNYAKRQRTWYKKNNYDLVISDTNKYSRSLAREIAQHTWLRT
jgi:tRNA dimethylallyltransferase